MKRSVNLDGINLSYDETGKQEGKPVILMHGWGCTSRTVAGIAAILSENYKVYNIDLPGHGESSEPPLLTDGKPWGVEEYADLIEKFILKEGLEKPNLIGHSYGGRVAIILASKNDIDKLVLVDSAGIKPKRSLKYYWKVYSFKTAKKCLPLLIGKTRSNTYIEKKRNKSGSADYNNSTPMMRMVMSRSVNQDLKKFMPLIKAPTLLIWGEKDTATPLSDAKVMEKLIPDAGLVSFPNCGHYSFLDNPRGFRAVMESFFNINQ